MVVSKSDTAASESETVVSDAEMAASESIMVVLDFKTVLMDLTQMVVPLLKRLFLQAFWTPKSLESAVLDSKTDVLDFLIAF